VGSFTIVDDVSVSAYDVGNNFLCSFESIGSSRAATVAQSLASLNPDVRAQYVIECPLAFARRLDLMNHFQLVIAAQLPHNQLITLADHLYDNNIPLIIIKSNGFLGWARLQLKEHAGS
jgi:amyloid beta precursor protein binding protein 1